MGSIQSSIGGAWDQVLKVVQALIVPNWNDWIAFVPVALVLGVLGPIFTLLAAAWLHHRLTRRVGHVRLAEPGPAAVARDAAGAPLVPANVPYCSRDGLLYAGRATVCKVCRDELTVRCPVDDTLRPAGDQLCRACGTRYVLAAATAAVAVRRAAGPPDGGAAIA